MTSATNFKQRNQAEDIEMPGIRISVILSTACSGGKLTILEEEISVGAGSPQHICNHEDKVLLITEGKFTLHAGGKAYEAEKARTSLSPAASCIIS